MNKYQIFEESNSNIYHAVSKAPNDIKIISKTLNFSPLSIIRSTDANDYFSKIKRQKGYFLNWKEVYSKIEYNSVLLLQHPFRMRQIGREYYIKKLKKKKNIKIISLIHDVEELRETLFNDYYKNEFMYMLKIADVFIVHNNRMKDFFIKKGVDSNKIITLKIFDYLRDDYKNEMSKFNKSVTIAGNLDTKKAAYLKQLSEVNAKFDLYGTNYSLHSYDNCRYHGSLPTDKIPNVLNSGFGLIWDGNSIDKCSGPTGNYLRYNNPHKLSLYLSSNLPVIIWNGAAEAHFVKKYNLGLTIDSLLELPNIFENLTLDDYNVWAKNVLNIAPDLVSGHFTKSALEKALKIIGEN